MATDPIAGQTVTIDGFVEAWKPGIIRLKADLASLLDGKVTARDDYGLDYDDGIDFGTIRQAAADSIGFRVPYIYQCGRSATRRSTRTATPAGVGIETVEARGRKVVPLWTVEGGDIPLSYLRILAWTFDQYSRQNGTGRRDTLCGPVIATAAAASAIKRLYDGPCLRTMLGDDGTKDGNRVDLRSDRDIRITAHLVRSCNLVDLRFNTWEEDVIFHGTTMILAGRAKARPEAAIRACLGRRIGDVIGSSLFADDQRTVTSVTHLASGLIQFGISQPREGIVIDI